MRRIFLFLFIIIIISCKGNETKSGKSIITVSIAPFKYFVEEIAGNDFTINIMVPAGADPHTYEPFPEQIINLRKSVAYVSNGYLGFEMTWLERFYETNPGMKKLSLGDKIDPLDKQIHHDGGHTESADPHYWVSPKCAIIIAGSVKDMLCDLNPAQKEKYVANYQLLISKIDDVNSKCQEYFKDVSHRSFMIYHPNLGYIARDYGLEEIPVEFEGKEPTPDRLRHLIDRARKDNLKTIFVQREYDTKNAKAIAAEIGASIVLIDPLSENWQQSTVDIIDELHKSLSTK